MAKTYAGSIDHLVSGETDPNMSTVGAAVFGSEAFVPLFNLLSGPNAVSLGITRIAYNVGHGGTGIGFWDESPRVGDNCWGLWRFGNASTPFYLLAQVNTGSAADFGAFPGNPGVLDGPYGYGFGFAFAMRSDGGSPWTGTTNNNGADTKGATVWTNGGGGATLMVWPRCNSDMKPVGDYSTLKQAMMHIVASPYGQGALDSQHVPYTRASYSRVHYIIADDQFVCALEPCGNGSYNFLYFGKYVAANPSLNTIPYAAWSIDFDNRYSGGGGFGHFSGGSWVYGLPQLNFAANSGFNPFAWLSGGIVDPISKNVGSLVLNYMEAIHVNSDGAAISNKIQPSQLTRRFDLFNIPVGILNVGYAFDARSVSTPPSFLGEIEFIKMVSSLPSNSKLGEKWMVIGGDAAQSSKIAIPWSPTYSSYGLSRDRTGFQFITTQ